jgi:ornithine cyclodeaminase
MSGKPAPFAGRAVPHLDDHFVSGLLDLASVTDALEAAFLAWGRGEAATTQRVRSQAGGAMASAMAAVAPPYSGGKLYATNRGVFTFVVVLFDMDGRLLCTLDGDALTRLRTPATCALAVRLLAPPAPAVATVVGAGRQGWAHLQMLVTEIPDVREVRIHDHVTAAGEAMVARARARGIPAVAADSPTAAVADADVIVTATQSATPLFAASAIGNRALICAVGSTKDDRCEIGPDVVERCTTVVCDDAVGSRVECGDLIHAAATGRFDWSRAVELHDVVAGNVDVERAGTAPMLFETQGVALQDVAVAGLAFERYVARFAARPSAHFTSPAVPTVRKDAR